MTAEQIVAILATMADLRIELDRARAEIATLRTQLDQATTPPA